MFSPNDFPLLSDAGQPTLDTAECGNVLHVQKVIGLENIHNVAIDSTLGDKLYNVKGDDFHFAVDKTLEDARKLLEVGFEHFADVDVVRPVKKRK